MAKHRAITLIVNIAIDPEMSSHEVRTQIQNFIIDAYHVQPPAHDDEPEWWPFDVNAASVTITRDEIIYVEEEDAEEEEIPEGLPAWILDPGEA